MSLLKEDIVCELLNSKLEDTVIFEMLQGYFARVVIVTSADSVRQIAGISNKILDVLKKKGYYNIRVIGPADGGWVLIDCNDIILHMFSSDARDEYKIEELLKVNAHTIERLQGLDNSSFAQE